MRLDLIIFKDNNKDHHDKLQKMFYYICNIKKNILKQSLSVLFDDIGMFLYFILNINLWVTLCLCNPSACEGLAVFYLTKCPCCLEVLYVVALWTCLGGMTYITVTANLHCWPECTHMQDRIIRHLINTNRDYHEFRA